MCADSDPPHENTAAAGDDSQPVVGWQAVSFHKWTQGKRVSGEDPLVIEEPVEYRFQGESVATVMRTPGHDRDLAIGFFFLEGWISGPQEIGVLCICGRDRKGRRADDLSESNVVDLVPSQGTRTRTTHRRRLQPVMSSCGVCGKRSIEDVLMSVPKVTCGNGSRRLLALKPSMITALTRQLYQHQSLFHRTGTLHAAGIYEASGRLIQVREDIGRHNAVDKVIGALVRVGQTTLDQHILVVSGRTSFEIIQKALRAQIPVVISVSGVSSLAVELADRGGITLCGFTRDQSFSSYTHAERILW